MKVLFIASGNHGAPSPVVQNQAEALMAEGVEIEWYLLKGKGIKGYLRNVKPLRQYSRSHKFDAIHVHYSLSAFVASLAGAKPLVVSLMGSDVKASSLYKYIIRLFARLFKWKAIIVKSGDMYKDLGIPKAVVIPNGVDINKFYPMDKAECQKRLGWSSEQTHILFPADKNRPEKDYALASASVNRLKNAVLHSFSNTPHEDTPFWYNAADVVLLTSKWEGSPNAIKEAMACSRPIVSTNVGDVLERMKGVDGCFVIEERSPEKIAAALSTTILLTTTHGRERIISDKLDTENGITKLTEIYYSCLQFI